MIDRQKTETILRKRFDNANWAEVTAAANAIMGLGDEWREIECRDAACVARELEPGADIRVFRCVVHERLDKWQAGITTPPQRILVPLDGSPLAELALIEAVALSRLPNTEVTLLQVVPPIEGHHHWPSADRSRSAVGA